MIAADTLAAELAALALLDAAALRIRWLELVGSPPPKMRADMLRLALASEMQTSVHGGLSRGIQQRLAQVAAAKTVTTQAAPGMRLVREWKGVLHSVTIAEDGTVHWDGRSWKSLSVVARTITGSRWSGPAFFGLKKAKAAA